MTPSATSPWVGSLPSTPKVFAGADYVALGHLHGRQRVRDGVRYSGSPVALSFSEAAHTKGSWLVDLSESGVTVEAVDAPVERPSPSCAATSTCCSPIPPSLRPSARGAR